MEGERPRKRMRLRRDDVCKACSMQLAAGTWAEWDPNVRTVTCVPCADGVDPPPERDAEPTPPIDPAGTPGASAIREHERLHARVEQRRAAQPRRWLAPRNPKDPWHVRVWKQGAAGEVLTARRLAVHLKDKPVRLLHDRGVPGHGHANIDHIAIGPGGITVVDSKTHHGTVQVRWRGGLFTPATGALYIRGRKQTKLIDGVLKQIGWIQNSLKESAYATVSVRGALCFPDASGLPWLRQLTLQGVSIGGTRRTAKIAARGGDLTEDQAAELCQILAARFPPA